MAGGEPGGCGQQSMRGRVCRFMAKGLPEEGGKRRGGEESQADWITKQGVEE